MSGLPGVDGGKRGSRHGWACLVAALALGSFCAGISGCAAAPAQKQSAVASETTSAEATTAPAFDAEAISNLSGDEFQTALESLTDEQRAEVTAVLEARIAAKKPVVVAPPAKKVYTHLTSRAFKQLVKDPDSYIGKTYYIYGEITQFDAATGTEMFLAAVGPKKLRKSYGYVSYPQPAFLNGTGSQLKKYVLGDLFTAKVTVLGSYSYDTQAGGRTTVPQFQIDSISRYGSVD